MIGAVTLAQHERQSEEGPTLALDGVQLDAMLAETVWRRIEAYTAHRWLSREVIWQVEGPGEWVPPLYPARITLVEWWDVQAPAWKAATADPAPSGLAFRPGRWRVTAIVGEDVSPPPEVIQAFGLLADYLRTLPLPMGATRSERTAENGEHFTHRYEVEAPASRMARALQYSGAADLLRPYRRAPA